MCLPAVMGELTAFRAKLLDCQKHIKVGVLASPTPPSSSAHMQTIASILTYSTPSASLQSAMLKQNHRVAGMVKHLYVSRAGLQ